MVVTYSFSWPAECGPTQIKFRYSGIPAFTSSMLSPSYAVTSGTYISCVTEERSNRDVIMKQLDINQLEGQGWEKI
jgi:hypothetical protein